MLANREQFDLRIGRLTYAILSFMRGRAFPRQRRLGIWCDAGVQPGLSYRLR